MSRIKTRIFLFVDLSTTIMPSGLLGANTRHTGCVVTVLHHQGELILDRAGQKRLALLVQNLLTSHFSITANSDNSDLVTDAALKADDD